MTEMLKVYSETKISFLSGAEILNIKVGKSPRKSISTILEGFEYFIPKEFRFFLVGNEYLFEGFKFWSDMTK